MTHPSPPTPVDVLIIGAGPAGSLAAGILAQRGHHVLCVERTYFPRFSIGESLLPRCNDILRQAGMLDAVVARNYMVKPGATFWWLGRSTRFRFAEALPGDEPSTFQVPRGDFDQTLATAARRLGADVQFGREVTKIEMRDDGAVVEVADVEGGTSQRYLARFLLDCSGYAHVLPRMLGLEKPPGMPTRTATFTMVEGDRRPTGEERGDLWVCLDPSVGWLWIIPFSDGRTSVGLVTPADPPGTPTTSPRDRLWSFVRGSADASRRLGDAVPVLETKTLTAWSSAATRLYGPGWAIAGNSGDFLDPVFSSGVALAFESSSRAAELIDATLANKGVDWQRDYTEPMGRAVTVFRAFVESWYNGELREIFFAGAQRESIRRAITSVLAGYVIDRKSSLVRNPRGAIAALTQALRSGAPLTDEMSA
ncbi:MAG: NAD(P)/FAD-dependent oxidoreductase [Myxococcota bacterium]